MASELPGNVGRVRPRVPDVVWAVAGTLSKTLTLRERPITLGGIDSFSCSSVLRVLPSVGPGRSFERALDSQVRLLGTALSEGM